MEKEKIIPITRPFFDEKEMQMVKECLDSGWVTQGPMTERLEVFFSQVHKCDYAIAVSSCTAALHLAVIALGIGPGDEVLVPAFTWITSANCIEYAGATVKFVDIDLDTFNIDPLDMEKKITDRTKAVVVVHLFGCAANMDEIVRISKKHKLYIIEDCACAIGTQYKGKSVGTFGDIGCFSFHPRKAITTGEGGMCSTNNKILAEKIKQLRNHGARMDKHDPNYGKAYYMGIFDVLGYNLRLSDIQAAVGVAQFTKLDGILKLRKECAEYYIKKLKNMKGIKVPDVPEDYGHTYQSFVILIDGNRNGRNSIMGRLLKENIQTRPGTLAVHNTKYYTEKYGLQEGDFPKAAIAQNLTITLPIYPNMDRKDQNRVISAFMKAFQQECI